MELFVKMNTENALKKNYIYTERQLGEQLGGSQ
jgi:hypothetical protein